MRYFFGLLILAFTSSAVSCSSTKYANVSYLPSSESTVIHSPKLNIFAPKNIKADAPVLIFVHGGYWNSGKKDDYNLLGRNFASKGIVCVIPDYTLSPEANYDVMTKEIAAVIKWVQGNGKPYKINPKQIFITGHSAGGHLAALAVMNPKYGIDPKTVSGIILNDAAGLDMKSYLELYPPTTEHDYLTTWTTDPAKWKDASPIYFIDALTPKMMLYVGTKTYPSIKEGNERFIRALNEFQPTVKPIFLKKKHAPMVIQFINPCNKRFQEIIDFMNSIN